jgi:hypothetical protein
MHAANLATELRCLAALMIEGASVEDWFVTSAWPRQRTVRLLQSRKGIMWHWMSDRSFNLACTSFGTIRYEL